MKPLVEYFEWTSHVTSDVEDINIRIDVLWLKQERLSCIIEVIDQLLCGDFADELTGEDDLAVVRCQLEDLALNSLNVTWASRGTVSLDGGFKELEKNLMEMCEEEAVMLAAFAGNLTDPDHADEARAGLTTRRNECQTEFQGILNAKTANTEIKEDLQEHSDILKERVRASLQDILHRMAAQPLIADVQSNGCMWLAALAASGADDRHMILSSGGLQALTQAIRRHPTDNNVQLNGCRGLCFLAEEGTREQSELAAVEEDMGALTVAESRLSHEQELLLVALKAVANIMSGCDSDEVLQQMHTEMEVFPACVRGSLFGLLFEEKLAVGESGIFTSSSGKLVRRRSVSFEVSSGRTPALDSRLKQGQASEIKVIAEKKLQQILEEANSIVDQKARAAEKLSSLGTEMADAQGPASEGFRSWKRLPGVSRRFKEIVSASFDEGDDIAETLGVGSLPAAFYPSKLANATTPPADGYPSGTVSEPVHASDVPEATATEVHGDTGVSPKSEDLRVLSTPHASRFTSLLPRWAMKGLQARSRKKKEPGTTEKKTPVAIA